MCLINQGAALALVIRAEDNETILAEHRVQVLQCRDTRVPAPQTRNLFDDFSLARAGQHRL